MKKYSFVVTDKMSLKTVLQEGPPPFGLPPIGLPPFGLTPIGRGLTPIGLPTFGLRGLLD